VSVRVLVLGLGNVLCADDGLGVVALEALRRGTEPAENVRLLDGGTLGLALLAHLEDADEVLVLDAVRAEGEVGSLVRLEDDEVEVAARERLSPHQVGVADLLSALRWRGTTPSRLVLLGLVPGSLEPELGLTPEVKARIPALAAAALRELRSRGHELETKEADEADRPQPGDGSLLALLS